jgi:hypothetical protein
MTKRRAFLTSPPSLVFVLLALVSNLPYARAILMPPAGTRFVGVFYSIPDVYNYFSYMQQAEDGAFVFVNKLTLDPHAPALVNLEWWAVGRLSGLTGLGLPLAFRILGLGATFLLVVGVDRWLTSAGLPERHRLGALLLVFLGGGFGGVLFLVLGPPAWRFLDLTTGLFPCLGILVNPHFVTGAALLVWALIGLVRGGAGTALGLVLGNGLGLSRPYDLVLLVGIRVLSVAMTRPPSKWPRELLPLLGFLPAVLVNYRVLYASPAFRMLSGFKYVLPDFGGYALALGPALALAALGARVALAGEGTERAYRTALLAWAVMALFTMGGLAIVYPYLAQSAANIGVPLFGLAALGLAGRPPRVLLLVALFFSTTGVIALKLLLEDNPSWFVPKERIEAALALHDPCRGGGVVMAPPEIGMYVNAYSACRAYVTHVVAPDTAEREQEMSDFYLHSEPAERQSLLDRRCVTQLVLPRDGEDLAAFLGTGSTFRRGAAIGQGPGALAIYSREKPPGCSGHAP